MFQAQNVLKAILIVINHFLFWGACPPDPRCLRLKRSFVADLIAVVSLLNLNERFLKSNDTEADN